MEFEDLNSSPTLLIFTVTSTSTNQLMPKPPIQIKRSTKPQTDCGLCGERDCLKEEYHEHEMVVRDETLIISSPQMVCQECGVGTSTFEQADRAVAIAVTTYQEKHDLLTGERSKKRRKSLSMNQADLAEASGVGIASIKRLESGVHVLNQLQNDAIVRSLEDAEQDQLALAAKNWFSIEWTAQCGGWSTLIEEPEIVAEHSLDAMAIDDGSDCEYAGDDQPFAMAS